MRKSMSPSSPKSRKTHNVITQCAAFAADTARRENVSGSFELSPSSTGTENIAVMPLSHIIRGITYSFDSLKDLLAKASPARSGDELAGISARSAEERVAARLILADLPLDRFLREAIVPYESDEVTRLILDTHDAHAFAAVSSFTVGEFRDWLLSDQATGEVLAGLAPGVTPEMAAAVSKLMPAQDLVAVARKIR